MKTNFIKTKFIIIYPFSKFSISVYMTISIGNGLMRGENFFDVFVYPANPVVIILCCARK
jgi:hypothetical protein